MEGGGCIVEMSATYLPKNFSRDHCDPHPRLWATLLMDRLLHDADPL